MCHVSWYDMTWYGRDVFDDMTWHGRDTDDMTRTWHDTAWHDMSCHVMYIPCYGISTGLSLMSSLSLPILFQFQSTGPCPSCPCPCPCVPLVSPPLSLVGRYVVFDLIIIKNITCHVVSCRARTTLTADRNRGQPRRTRVTRTAWECPDMVPVAACLWSILLCPYAAPVSACLVLVSVPVSLSRYEHYFYYYVDVIFDGKVPYMLKKYGRVSWHVVSCRITSVHACYVVSCYVRVI